MTPLKQDRIRLEIEKQNLKMNYNYIIFIYVDDQETILFRQSMNILHQTNLSKQSRFFTAKKQEKPLHPLFFIPPLILKPVLFPI